MAAAAGVLRTGGVVVAPVAANGESGGIGLGAAEPVERRVDAPELGVRCDVIGAGEVGPAASGGGGTNPVCCDSCSDAGMNREFCGNGRS